MNTFTPLTADFDQITQFVAAARLHAAPAGINTLIDLYWQVGQAARCSR
jgi:hypothetical protein